MQAFHSRRTLVFTVLWTLLLAYVFANVEVQVEGAAGWAGNLPTWRIEHHWLLDLLWGGRPMTGYHAWAFPFMALFFHFPLIFHGTWTWRAQARVIGCIAITSFGVTSLMRAFACAIMSAPVFIDRIGMEVMDARES